MKKQVSLPSISDGLLLFFMCYVIQVFGQFTVLKKIQKIPNLPFNVNIHFSSKLKDLTLNATTVIKLVCVA